MRLKCNYSSNELIKESYKILIVAVILSLSTMALMDWYITPTLSGMNTVSNYLHENSDNIYLELSDFNLEQEQGKFLEKFLKVTSDDTLTVNESVLILRGDLDKVGDSVMDDVYEIVIYQFSPLITLPAVIYLHFRFWLWVSNRIIKLFRLNNEKPLKVWRFTP